MFDDPLGRARQAGDSSPHRPCTAPSTDALAVSATGRRIALMSGEGTVHVWDLADSALMRRSAMPIDSTVSVTA